MSADRYGVRTAILLCLAAMALGELLARSLS
jgi:hypothetical protein